MAIEQNAGAIPRKEHQSITKMEYVKPFIIGTAMGVGSVLAIQRLLASERGREYRIELSRLTDLLTDDWNLLTDNMFRLSNRIKQGIPSLESLLLHKNDQFDL